MDGRKLPTGSLRHGKPSLGRANTPVPLTPASRTQRPQEMIQGAEMALRHNDAPAMNEVIRLPVGIRQAQGLAGMVTAFKGTQGRSLRACSLASNSVTLKGFAMYSSAPAISPSNWSTNWALALSMRILQR